MLWKRLAVTKPTSDTLLPRKLLKALGSARPNDLVIYWIDDNFVSVGIDSSHVTDQLAVLPGAPKQHSPSF